jgi:tetratricopeptide (TPR) repeat protein
MRCLEKLPADRWQRADDLKVQFESMSTPSGGMTPTGTQPVVAVSADAGARHVHPARVAGLFGLASIGVLIIVYALVQAIGLPYWVLVGAIGLLAAGLPIMMLTGYHERVRAIAQTAGVSVATPPGVKRHFTWQKSLMGGGLAFTGLAVVAAGYMAMRALGIGPAATLMATGALQEQDRLILADFENRTGDSTLGPSVTEAFRIDLAQSPVIRLMGGSEIGPVLGRMSRDPNAPLDRQTAVQVAEREGVKAIVAGEIGPVGGGYVLSARVLAAADGSELLALRENAASDSELLPSIDRLSGRLLKTIRANEPLERVTTSSPEALRKYSQGVRAFDRGDHDRSRALLEEAIGIDTTFAMAYRKLGALLNNMLAPLSLREETIRKAHLHRDRLPDIERYLATAHYYYDVEYNPDGVRTNYLNVLDLDPRHSTALNNLSLQLNFQQDYEEAERYGLRAAEAAPIASAYMNALWAQIEQGAFQRAESTLQRMETELPVHPWTSIRAPGQLLVAQQHYSQAEALFLELRKRFATVHGPQAEILSHLIAIAQLHGRLATATQYAEELLALEEERNRPDNSLRRVVNVAELDILYRDRMDDAVAKVDAALERYPLAAIEPLDRPYFVLADFYAEAGRPERARQLLEEYEQEIDQQTPRRPAFYARSLSLSRGAVALAEGRYEEAIPHLRAGREEHRCRDCGNFNLAVAYEQAGQSDSAIAEYELLVSKPGYDRDVREADVLAATYKRLGELHEERGEREKAVEYYNSFVELWANADEELQGQVSDVRNRIARLVSET